MRNTIGGSLDYRRLADLHKPQDEATLRAAAQELRSRGLTAQDIAQALSIATPMAQKLLGEAPK